eukprot:CAMPEP_0173170174 /NCGR_PEP_ID=MMETSP1141-20130122/1096_1 /TAXON_ID=483371 /ORGANISM="non described non described, Strain CCMP2298" /LENGTH=663 /DNA_ID=CAMNT_0014092049 /DNA_START=17 /DNA_END=2005 /DNA_ORIENTATION=+
MVVDFDEFDNADLEGEFSLIDQLEALMHQYNPLVLTANWLHQRWGVFLVWFRRQERVVWVRVQYKLLVRRVVQFIQRQTSPPEEHEGQAHGLANMSTAAMGGASASWRSDRTIQRKFILLQRLQVHIVSELRRAKTQFVAEHELLISVLDATVDSAGMFTLAIPFHFDRMDWLLVLFFELTLYAIGGAALNLYAHWTQRALFFLGVNNIFQLLTYLCDPYTELLDKWLDFNGRLLVSFVLLGTIYCAQQDPDAARDTRTDMYEPWGSFDFAATTALRSFGAYQVVDLCMVVSFYSYVVYVLYAIGALGVIDRMLKSFQFGYHDHVLDFLVENLDKRTYGLENVLTGLKLLQQWDDVIRMQRRYALVAWPDVRPANIMPLRAKLLEVKWASMFNLTLANLRSSLGLTVLHTVMFSADGDVARWIIHSNPQLLTVEDSQSDTPITIALKECAYFLIAYGQQNDGTLDDGTAYSDEAYTAYYPEVDDIRDEIFLYGEFVPELCTATALTSQDLIMLKEQGVYVEKGEKVKSPHKAAKPKLDIYGNRIYSQEELLAQKEERKSQRAARVLVNRTQAEKNSVFMGRFPEDEQVDDYEVGEMAAWGVVSTTVPVQNLFLDPVITKRTLKDDEYSFAPPAHDLVHGRVVRRETMDLEAGLVQLSLLESAL